MNGQQVELAFLMLYVGVTVISMIACCYLLFRRGNAFAANVTSPVRLRRWAAALFGSLALAHVWYLPTYFLSPGDAFVLCSLIGGLLDSVVVFPLGISILFVMLQDRKRPLWPIAVMMVPIVGCMIWGIFTISIDMMPIVRVYFALLTIGILIYMVREVRRYGRWLRLAHESGYQSYSTFSLAFKQRMGQTVTAWMRKVTNEKT